MVSSDNRRPPRGGHALAVLRVASVLALVGVLGLGCGPSRPEDGGRGQRRGQAAKPDRPHPPRNRTKPTPLVSLGVDPAKAPTPVRGGHALPRSPRQSRELEEAVAAEFRSVGAGMSADAMGYAQVGCIWCTVTSCEPRSYQMGRITDDEVVFYVGFACEGYNSDTRRPMRGQVFVPRNLVRQDGRWVTGSGWVHQPPPVVQHGEWYAVGR